MATKNIVPRGNGEGSLGTSEKKWDKVYTNDVVLADGESVTNKIDAKSNKAATLAGYGITDAFTKTEADNRFFSRSGGTVTGNVKMQAIGTSNYKEIEFSDRNGNRIGVVRGTLNESGNEKHYMSMNVVDTNGVNHNGLTVAYDEVNNKANCTVFSKEVERVNDSGDNYIRYENGLQICWGNIAQAAISANTTRTGTETYPVAFKEAPSVTLTTLGNDTNMNYVYVNAQLSNVTASNFAFNIKNGSSGNCSPSVKYMAVGFWK